MLAGLLAEWRARRPDVLPLVLSADPGTTRTLHGVEARPRSPRAVWNTLAGARLFISGGGSLVQDVTSARSALYYLGTLFAASWRGVPVAVVGQGIGPLHRPWIRWLARRAFDRAQVISVRDAGSSRALTDLGVTRAIHRGADLALLAAPAPVERLDALLARAGLDTARSRIGVAVRSWPGLLDPRTLGQALRRFAVPRGMAIAVLMFDPIHDRPISQALAEACGGRLVEAGSPQDLLAITGAMDLVLGVRLHALIFAASRGTPALGLSYDPKVSAFMADLGLQGLPVGTSVEALEQALARAWEQRAELRAHLAAVVPELRTAAASGVQAAVALLGPPAAGEGRQEFRRG